MGRFYPGGGVSKIAYAPGISANPYRASFQKEYFEKYIGTFQYLSIRESCHREFIQQYTDKTVHFVCDPTLLLKRDKYLSLIETTNPDKPSDPYIFYYQPNAPDGAVISLVNKLARMYNLDIVHTFADIPSAVFANRAVSAKFAGPLEFLSYIKDASIVITRSYHAAIFAIQFQRPVYAYVDKKTGARFESLFSALGMKDRLVYDYIKPEDVVLTYDYQNAYDKLAVFRRESLQFLSEALQTEYCI